MTIDYSQITPEQLNSMSDEEFAKIDPSKLPDTVFNIEESQGDDEPQYIPDSTPTPPAEEVPADVTTPDAEPASEGVPSVVEGEAEQPAGTVPNEAGEATQPPATDPATPDATTTPDAPVTDTPKSKADLFMEKVTAKFTASGREYTVDNPDDAVQLMQMGINYNQKMAALKPTMKMVKALEDQGIRSLEDLGFLLDLKAKKPEAIAKLIQESGIDSYDLNEEKAAAYQQSVPEVSDARINFEMEAQKLEHNPHFATVVDELRGFDQQTKDEIFSKPHLLGVLTQHVQGGHYQAIRAELDKQQALGRTNGMSFLQAYEAVGNMLFGAPAQEPQAPATPVVPAAIPVAAAPVPQPVPVPVAQKPNPSNNAARQAAAGTTSTAAQVQKLTMTPEELWSLSDEEFAKLNPKFL